MRAIVQNGYGAPETVLSVAEVPRPRPGPGEVILRVMATSVNTPDWLLSYGLPYLLRPALGGLFGPKGAVWGTDVAGIVEELGPGVTDLQPGDEVFGSTQAEAVPSGRRGAFCSHAVALASHLAPKPPALGWEAAAGLGMSATVALQAVRDVVPVGPGSEVLINGASGGIGTFAIQIARARGARVTAVCSAANDALVRELGAERVIDYATEDYTRGPARYDLILDNVLNHPPPASAAVLTPTGRLIPNSVGPGDWAGSLGWMLVGAVFRSRQWPTVSYAPLRANLAELAEAVVAGRLRVVIDRVYPFVETPKAVAHMASHRARGKIVIRVGLDD